MTKEETIRLYYQCMGEKIKNPLYEILQPDLLFTSQYAVYNNRDKMIDEIWPNVGKTKAEDLEIFGAGEKYMVRYKIKTHRYMAMSEYIEFRYDKISKIEVYIGFEFN